MPEKPKVEVLVGMPSRDGYAKIAACCALFRASQRPDIMVAAQWSESSVTEMNMNQIWNIAVDFREKYGTKYLIVLHNDVCPQPYFGDVLLHEIQDTRGDVVSAVIPYRKSAGKTSTGVGPGDYRIGDNFARKLFLKEIFRLPETFNTLDITLAHQAGRITGPLPEDPKLWVNTGCMIVDITKDWVKDYCWQMHSRSWYEDGRRMVDTISEDWVFADDIQKLGLDVYATRKVPIFHDNKEWHNTEPYGEERDEAYCQKYGSMPELPVGEAVARGEV